MSLLSVARRSFYTRTYLEMKISDFVCDINWGPWFRGDVGGSCFVTVCGSELQRAAVQVLVSGARGPLVALMGITVYSGYWDGGSYNSTVCGGAGQSSSFQWWWWSFPFLQHLFNSFLCFWILKTKYVQLLLRVFLPPDFVSLELHD